MYSSDDPHNLQRFVEAQNPVIDQVKVEPLERAHLYSQDAPVRSECQLNPRTRLPNSRFRGLQRSSRC